MYLFDSVCKKEINNTFDVFAYNERDKQHYLLRNICMETSESDMDGFRLHIKSGADRYVFRDKFNTKEELKAFKKKVCALFKEVEELNAER